MTKKTGYGWEKKYSSIYPVSNKEDNIKAKSDRPYGYRTGNTDNQC